MNGENTMEIIRLIEPTEDYANEIWTLRQEIIDQNDPDQFAGCGKMQSCQTAQEWIELVKNGNDEKKLTGGIVPSNTYLAIRTTDQRVVGVIDLRHHIDHPILGTWGGHIGYSVRPLERRKGYATEMLRLNLLRARELGIKKVLVTCDTNNQASETVIQKNGGIFDQEILVDDSIIKRYWIIVEREE